MTKTIRHWGACLAILLLVGCSSRPSHVDDRPTPDDMGYAPPMLDYSLPDARSGSVYRDGYMWTLFQDRRAYRVGDMLTVSLDEDTRSSKQANTNFGKNASGGLSGGFATGSSSGSASGDLSGNRDFRGSSASSQRNSLSGSITVMVHGVLPNGVLRIKGEKWIRLNQGDEFIRLNGLVRVDDIDNANQISSQRVGDARITYSQSGVLADANEAGWLTQLFVNPLFPI
ncbi:flagellar basal body L-ring protein FlgH [Photobacterium minamisatsumaniensis]|uniref:flagellar basal body L-ring protein FlgH n=1 Tax=Photobacterium minamisatsumaniensis TaxID=2910233 RepID=UPI003D105B9F